MKFIKAGVKSDDTPKAGAQNVDKPKAEEKLGSVTKSKKIKTQLLGMEVC